MTTQNITSVKAMESTVEQKVEGIPAYGTPELFEIGTAAELLQGTQLNARYYDRHNSGRTWWPN